MHSSLNDHLQRNWTREASLFENPVDPEFQQHY
jgi:hypothetical protein